jgi:hypothetical protein
MRICFVTALFIFSRLACFSQKPVIDADATKNWKSIDQPSIANNGAYMMYTINNQPIGKNTLVITGINNNWRLELPDVKNGSFSSSSKYVFFKNDNDSLVIIETGISNTQYIPMVQSHMFNHICFTGMAMRTG